MVNRFKAPQANYFEQACKELRNGRKTSHWIWYIFPQVVGLGYSHLSNYYGIENLEEAEAYLDKFTYPQDFEIVNLRVHPEFLEEDFTQGVGAPLGADQGIPSSMQCCAVPMMRLGEPAPYGKIQKPYPGHRPPPPHKRHKPIGVYLLGSNVNLLTYGRKKKKKKSIKRR